MQDTAALPKPPSRKFVERFRQFLRASRSRNVMSDHTSKGMRLHRRHFAEQILNHRPANGDKGVAVVKTERREFVAFAADVQSLTQGEFMRAGGFPELPRGRVAVRSRLMKRFLFLAQ